MALPHGNVKKNHVTLYRLFTGMKIFFLHCRQALSETNFLFFVMVAMQTDKWTSHSPGGLLSILR